jgi:hypothetical protein
LTQATATAGAAQAAGLAQAGPLGAMGPTGMYNAGFPATPTVALPAGYAVAAASSSDYYSQCQHNLRRGLRLRLKDTLNRPFYVTT